MRTAFFILLVQLLYFPQLAAQVFPQFPNPGFVNWSNTNCPYGGTNPVVDDWEAYQTTNGEWDGTRDSICFDSYDPSANFRARFKASDVDLNKPFFLRCLLDSSNKIPLDSNTLYSISTSLNTQNSDWISSNGDTCGNMLCTGMRVAIEIPDSLGTGTALRWYSTNINNNGNWGNLELCIPAEKFPGGNFIREIYFKIKADEQNTPNSAFVDLYAPEIQPMFYNTWQVKSVAASAKIGTRYYYDFTTEYPTYGIYSNFHTIYTDTSYPNPLDISWVECSPSPNTNVQDTIDLIVPQFNAMIFSPFTAFRGGLVAGDTLRHIINLINDGGTMCFPPIIELVFENGDAYTYRAGKLNFDSPKSCMLFGRGGFLELPSGSQMEYGKGGSGMLALKTGGELRIAPGARLNFGGTMVIGEYSYAEGHQDIYLSLPHGAELNFLPGSKLKNVLSRSGLTQLVVSMEGGQLDDSGLSAQDRLLIRRVYPTPSAALEANLEILGNPVRDELNFSWLADAEGSFVAELVSPEGRRLQSKIFNQTTGVNIKNLQVSDLAPGIYFLRIRSLQGIVTRKWIHL